MSGPFRPAVQNFNLLGNWQVLNSGIKEECHLRLPGPHGQYVWLGHSARVGFGRCFEENRFPV